jgi:transcription termination/antitermination protein NusA
MDIKNFTSAMAQIAEEKGIPVNKVTECIEAAIAAAYKKEYGEKGQIIRAKLDPVTGDVNFWQVKEIVSEDAIYTEEELEEMKEKKKEKEERKVRFNPERHILLKEAKKNNKKAKAGEEIETPLETKTQFGRIAAQTAKQVILQKIREEERNTIYSEYKEKEGEIVSGVIQRVEARNIFVDIGKTLGVLPKEERVYGEFYRPGQRLKFYLLEVQETPKGPLVVLSRAYPKLVSKLFELEVPEVAQGTVEIKSIAREPGSRTKIAVAAKEENIDPIGSAVGQRGTRVMAVINELGGEKIDIVEYSDDPEEYISNALSPAKIEEVKIKPKNTALCVVPDDQLSLAIGKEGQNVRLAARLTGWKIDIKTPEGEKIKTAEPEKEESSEIIEEEKPEKDSSQKKKTAKKKQTTKKESSSDKK